MPVKGIKRRETIVAVLRKNHKCLVAEPLNSLIFTFGRARDSGALEANAKFKPFPPVLIPKDKKSGAKKNQLAEVLIDALPDERLGRKTQAKGRVLRVLGDEGDVFAELSALVSASKIPNEFKKKTKGEALLVSADVLEEEANKRADLRKTLTVTLDGEDTRDFDDAVSIAQDGENYILGVHIADVAHYVKEGTQLDKEAKARGNSVYLPGLVIPMLPRPLSNGICSLIEGKDRLCLSVTMKIDKSGRVLSHEIEESVINIRRRLTYKDASAIIDGSLKENDKEIRECLTVMAELAKILSEKRLADGALDFDIEESKIILKGEGAEKDIEGGVVEEITVSERSVAMKIIEEFMIVTNRTVAERFFWSETPFVFRSHEAPDPEKTRELAGFLRAADISFEIKALIRGGKNALSHSKELQELLKAASNENIGSTAERRQIKRAILRSMKQARYSAGETSHFGLSAKYYCHFTSPIRRYADLQIHRIIKETIAGKIDEARFLSLCDITKSTALHVSETERLAEKLEREAVRLFKCEFMKDKTGEEFDALISHVAKHGIYVELPNMIEGMVSLNSLKNACNEEYYIFDELNMRYVGERTNETFKLGDTVRVRLVNVSVSDRHIDFIIERGHKKTRNAVPAF